MKGNVVSPVGRIVQGDIINGSDKDSGGKPLIDKNGNPYKNFFCRLAIEKSNPEWAGFWQQILNTALGAFPSYAAVINQLMQSGAGPDVITAQIPGVTWRVVDGDSMLPDQNGKIWRDKPGFAGCWVVSFSTNFAPQLVLQDPTKAPTPDQTAGMFGRGNYARIVTTLGSEQNKNGCFLYINLNIVQFMGYGEPISSGPDAGAILGGQAPAYVPAGMSNVPVGGMAPAAAPAAQQPMAPAAAPAAQQPMAPAAAQQPMAPAAPVAAPAPAAPVAAPGQAVQPNPAFLNAPTTPTA